MMSRTLTIVVTGSSKNIVNMLINTISDADVEKISRTYRPKGSSRQIEVYFQYGLILVNKNIQIDLYAVHKPSLLNYFDALEHKDFLGMILLLEGDRISALEDLKQTLKKHQKYLENNALIIGVTDALYANRFDVDDVNEILAENDLLVPVFKINPQNQSNVAVLMESLFYFNNPQLKYD